jgi:hypothetical protein
MKFPSDKEIEKIRQEREMFAGYLRNAQRIEELIGDTACLSNRYRELFQLGRYPCKQKIEEVFRTLCAFINIMKGELKGEILEELQAIADALEPMWRRSL